MIIPCHVKDLLFHEMLFVIKQKKVEVDKKFRKYNILYRQTSFKKIVKNVVCTSTGMGSLEACFLLHLALIYIESILCSSLCNHSVLVQATHHCTLETFTI